MIRQVVVVGWPTPEKRLAGDSLYGDADPEALPNAIASGMIGPNTIGDDHCDLEPLLRPVLRPNTAYGENRVESERASPMMLVRYGSSRDPVRLVKVAKKRGELTVRCVGSLASRVESPQDVLEY